MKTILVVDDSSVDRSPIGDRLSAAGYRAIRVGGGPSALEILHNDGADLILLDFMKSLSDALAFLRDLRADPATANVPVIMLSSEEDRQTVISAGQIGVQGYILRSSFSFEDLLRRVKNQIESISAIATIGMPSQDQSTVTRHEKLLTRESFIRRAEMALDGKTLAGVAAQVIAMAGSSQGDMSELANLAGQDALLSARILQVANSPVYRAGRPVSTLVDAIRQIGFACVRNIAASIGIYDAMPASSDDGFNPLLCWRHSFAVATLCERLVLAGQNTDVVNRHAYLVGLCHDLGEVLLRANFAVEFQAVLDEQARTGVARRDAERAVLGISHGELVATILQKLGLPEAIRHPIEVFHNGGAAHGPDAARLVNLLRLADLAANGALLIAGNDAEVEPVTRADFTSATGIQEMPSIDWQEFREEISAKTILLARLSADQSAQLRLPVYPKQDCRVWVARDPAMCSFDPLAIALQCMAQHVTIHDRLPTGDTHEACNKLIVVARDAAVPGLTANDISKFKAATVERPRPVLWLIDALTAKKIRQGAAGSPHHWRMSLSAIAEFIAQA